MTCKTAAKHNCQTFVFNHLPAHELVPLLIHYSKQQTSGLPWHICWLNNNGNPVIGLLPKTAWIAFPDNAGSDNKCPSADHNMGTQPHTVNIRLTKFNRAAAAPSPILMSHMDTHHMTLDEWVKDLIDYSNKHRNHHTSQSSIDSSYHEGLMGFIGYDISAKSLSPSSDIQLADQPCAFIGHYDIYLQPAEQQKWQLIINEAADRQAVERVTAFLTRLQSHLSLDIEACDAANKAQRSMLPAPALSLTHHWHYEHYQRAFAKAQHYLYQGDSYQINLTQKWQGKLEQSTDLVRYLPNLYTQTQAPYAGYVNLNTCYIPKDMGAQHQQNWQPFKAVEVLSCSPELFIMFKRDKDGQQRILTKPIKGTVARGATPDEDEAFKQQLAHSEKDKAENVMIVDLLRNDLGKYAKTGSVSVPKLFAIESFSNVHHMVSSINATLKEEHHPLTVLFDSLPAGSITGAPKKRAVEIISELESGPRGAYCGTMGYLNFDGSGQWNVLIRTLQANSHGTVELWAGGGITVGSECAAEYKECHDKVNNLIAILNP